MTHPEFADELDELARAVEQLPGVSRQYPHAFAEAKSELAGLMRHRASELRILRRGPDQVGAAGTVRAGLRAIRGRPVVIEVRASRRA